MLRRQNDRRRNFPLAFYNPKRMSVEKFSNGFCGARIMAEERLPAERLYDDVRQRAAGLNTALRSNSDRGGGFRTMLAEILPGQFGVAQGTVISSNRKLKPIAFDTLIHDKARNSPVFQAVGDRSFPIETVLAAASRIETVTPDRLDDLIHAILPLRLMAQRGKFYLAHEFIKKPNGKAILNLREYRSDAPPRTYIVTDTLIGWDKADNAAKAIKDALQQTDDGHLDGLLVLDRDWFFHQADNKQRIEAATADGTIRFIQKIITDLTIAEIGVISLARYAPD
jgi:hypothetical protein